ncbi:hypothetical protein [Kribbella sp. NPDC006257]|uniref:hypothetical protein n=1 Tax=Kribbella sp. NPDC006257 TaxID=3156738 RepID=UPI0033B30CCF
MTRLVVTSGMAAVYLGLAVGLGIARIWPAMALLAVFAAGWCTRVVVLLRMRRAGVWRDGQPQLATKYMAPVFVVQLAGWCMAAVYFVVIGFWLGLVVAVALAGMSFGVARLLAARR